MAQPQNYTQSAQQNWQSADAAKTASQSAGMGSPFQTRHQSQALNNPRQSSALPTESPLGGPQVMALQDAATATGVLNHQQGGGLPHQQGNWLTQKFQQAKQYLGGGSAAPQTRPQGPLVGIIDRGFAPGEHGHQMLRTIQQGSPDATILLADSVGTGTWANDLTQFVDVAKASGQSQAVVNLSFDLTQKNSDGSITTRNELTAPERDALLYAQQNGVLVVTSAGNNGGAMSALEQASGRSDNLIVVGAAEGGQRAAYSSFGSGLDFLVSLDKNAAAGTSKAAAKTTQTISKIWAANPDLTSRQVVQVLEASTQDLETPGWTPTSGLGIVKKQAAFQLSRAAVAKLSPVSQGVSQELAGSRVWQGSRLHSRTSERPNAAVALAAPVVVGALGPALLTTAIVVGAVLTYDAYQRNRNRRDRTATATAPTRPPSPAPQPQPRPRPAPPPPARPVNPAGPGSARPGPARPVARPGNGSGQQVATSPIARPAPGLRPVSTVRPGDTLSAIAQATLGSAARWRELRQADGSAFTAREARRLLPGTAVYLPRPRANPVHAASAATAAAIPGLRPVSRVRTGDTLWGIAQAALGSGTRWRELRQADGDAFTERDARRLLPGTDVFIPTPKPNPVLPRAVTNKPTSGNTVSQVTALPPTKPLITTFPEAVGTPQVTVFPQVLTKPQITSIPAHQRGPTVTVTPVHPQRPSITITPEASHQHSILTSIVGRSAPSGRHSNDMLPLASALVKQYPALSLDEAVPIVDFLLKPTTLDTGIQLITEQNIHSHFQSEISQVISERRGLGIDTGNTVKLPEFVGQRGKGDFVALEVKNQLRPDVDHAIAKFEQTYELIQRKYGSHAMGRFELYVPQEANLAKVGYDGYAVNSQGELVNAMTGEIVLIYPSGDSKAPGIKVHVIRVNLPPNPNHR